MPDSSKDTTGSSGTGASKSDASKGQASSQPSTGSSYEADFAALQAKVSQSLARIGAATEWRDRMLARSAEATSTATTDKEQPKKSQGDDQGDDQGGEQDQASGA